MCNEEEDTYGGQESHRPSPLHSAAADLSSPVYNEEEDTYMCLMRRRILTACLGSSSLNQKLLVCNGEEDTYCVSTCV